MFFLSPPFFVTPFFAVLRQDEQNLVFEEEEVEAPMVAAEELEDEEISGAWSCDASASKKTLVVHVPFFFGHL